MKRITFVLTLAALLAGTTMPAMAQDSYPSKTIRFVVPYPPGGPTDLMARLIQTELSTRLGVMVLIDNKSGAGGNIGSAKWPSKPLPMATPCCWPRVAPWRSIPRCTAPCLLFP